MREDAGSGLSLADFKTIVRDQFFTLLLDERHAVEAIPKLLDTDPELAQRMATTLRKLTDVLGVESKLGKSRYAEMTRCSSREKPQELPRMVRRKRVACSLPDQHGRQRRSRIGPTSAICS